LTQAIPKTIENHQAQGNNKPKVLQSFDPPFPKGARGITHPNRSPTAYSSPMPLRTSHFHLPYNPKLVERAKQMRRNPTPAEKKLWEEYLKTFPHRVLRQRPIDHFITDFYCAALRLVIEVDGEVHFSEAAQARDAERSIELEKYGLQIIRFTNDEVINNFNHVCQQLTEMIDQVVF
jgi:very-short-patch-repair endonuclease